MSGNFNLLSWLAAILLIIGGLNWGLVGFFHFNLVEHFLGANTLWTRVIYDLVGIAALYSIFLCTKCCKKS